MGEILDRLYHMTALSDLIADPSYLLMYLLAFVLLYLGIVKKYEPLLLIPIGFGVLIANFPGGEMGVIQANAEGLVPLADGTMVDIWKMPLHEIAHEFGIEIDGDTFDHLHRGAHYLLDIRPAGRWPAEFFYYAGGVPAIME